MADRVREKVKMSSLDEAFDANMRAILAGPATGEPASPPARPAAEDDLIGLLPERYGLVTVEPGQAREAGAAAGGGFLARIGRKLFATRGYHSLLYTLFARLDRAQREAAERERAAAERWNRLVERQTALNETLARTIFLLWGDYNHLVNTVLDHQINVVLDHQFNEVLPNVQDRLGQADRLGAEVRAFEDEANGKIVQLTALLRNLQRDFNEKIIQLTALLRNLQGDLNELKGPHDDMQKNVVDLVAGAARSEVLAAKLEDLEKRISRIEPVQKPVQKKEG